MSMVPYYEQDGQTIYCGDSREIIPSLENFDLVLTDPPYGAKAELNSKTARRLPWSVGGSRKKNAYLSVDDSIVYVREVVVPAFRLALDKSKRAIITPGNRCVTLYPPCDSFGAFYQPASVGLQRWGRCDAQPILYYGAYPHASRMIPGQSCSHQLTESPERNGHPCVKPIIAWTRLLLAGSLEGERVLDPFMGSGTTLVACKLQGRVGVGIDIEERYCEIAAKRLAQGVLFSGGAA